MLAAMLATRIAAASPPPDPAAAVIAAIIAIPLLLALYLLPWVIAAARKHHNATAIFVLNLFLGWTFLGWLGALIWALTAVDAPRRIAAA